MRGPQQQQPQPRLNLAFFDPRNVFPCTFKIIICAGLSRLTHAAPQNLDIVRALLIRVDQQIAEDRARLTNEPNNQLAKDARNESLSYFSLLNDWCEMAGPIVESQRARTAAAGPARGPAAPPRLRMVEAREAPMSVELAPGVRQMCECVVDIPRATYFIFVKSLRDTIYGHVALYQVGKLEDDGVVRPTNLAHGRVAIKMCKKDLVDRRVSRSGARVQEDPIRELAIQQRLSEPGHRYVMTLLTCLESADKIFAVYPFVGGGELFDTVSQNAPLPEVGARALMKGMVESIAYCHSAGVCHRDVSLENFMLGGDNNANPVLIDFGLSAIMEPAGTSPEGEPLWAPIPHTGALGKVYYMAPEVFSRSSPGYSGTVIDTWSLGVSLFIMLTGVPPWENPTTMDGRFRTIVVEHRLMDLLRQWRIHVSPEAGDLLQRLFVVDPARRITLREMARHPWMRGPA